MKCRREREGSESSLSPFCSSHCGRCPFRKFAAIELDFDPISRYTYQLFRIIHSSSEVSRSRGVEKSEVEIRGPCFDSLLLQTQNSRYSAASIPSKGLCLSPTKVLSLGELIRIEYNVKTLLFAIRFRFKRFSSFKLFPPFQAISFLLLPRLVPLPFEYEVDYRVGNTLLLKVDCS